MEKLSVPPGFASRTSFTLKRPRLKEDPCSSVHKEIELQPDPISTDTSSNISLKSKSFSLNRSWIIHSQLNHDAEDSELEQLDTVILHFLTFSVIHVRCIICIITGLPMESVNSFVSFPHIHVSLIHYALHIDILVYSS